MADDDDDDDDDGDDDSDKTSATRVNGLDADRESQAPSQRFPYKSLSEVAGAAKWSRSITRICQELTPDPGSPLAPTEGQLMSAAAFFLYLVKDGADPKSGEHSTRALFKTAGMHRDHLRSEISKGIGGIGTSPAALFLNDALSDTFDDAVIIGTEKSADGIIALRHLIWAFLRRWAISADWFGADFPIQREPVLRAFRDEIIKGPPSGTDRPNAWAEELQFLDSTLLLRGNRARLAREADDREQALDVKTYARILADLVRNADDKEFSLAIYGPWGRGKTYLTREVQKLLRSDRERYATVDFSAWKYPSRPEVWIHLYEAFARTRRKAGWVKSFAGAIRFGIERHGAGALGWLWLGLLISALPKIPLIKAVGHYLASLQLLVAGATILFAGLFGWRLWTTKTALLTMFFGKDAHAEKLGLQSTIGTDLKALLRAWIPAPPKKPPIVRGWFLYTGAATALVATIQWRAHDAPLVANIISGAVTAVAIAVPVLFALAEAPPKKILLVIDDLDRCPFDHLLAVVESVKLLIEDDEIQQRVQVAMLVEEQILQHAIWEKYKHLADKDAATALGTGFIAPRIVRENCEKIFTVHFRLNQLSAENVQELVDKFDGGRAPLESAFPITPAETARKVTQLEKTDSPPARESADKKTLPALPESGNKMTLGNLERDAIKAALAAGHGTNGFTVGPRTIRALIFRFQLARTILAAQRQNPPEPEELATALVESMLHGKAPRPSPEESSILRTVVAQVT